MCLATMGRTKTFFRIRPVLHLSRTAPDLSCIHSVLHLSCPATVLSCIHSILHPTCPASVLSYIWHVLHLSCPASILLISCPASDHPSCNAYDLSCINNVLFMSCPASVLSCIHPSLHQSCPSSVLFCSPASVLSFICHVLHPPYYASALSLHLTCSECDLSILGPCNNIRIIETMRQATTV